MAGIDQRRVRRLCGFDPRPGDGLTGGVEGDGDGEESLRAEFLVETLPPGQVKAASSPRSPGGEEHLASAVVAEGVLPSLQVWEGEVRRLERAERTCARFRGLADRPGVARRVMYNRLAEVVSETGHVETAVGHELRLAAARQRDADVAPAGALRFQRPAGRPSKLREGNPEPGIIKSCLGKGADGVFDEERGDGSLPRREQAPTNHLSGLLEATLQRLTGRCLAALNRL